MQDGSFGTSAARAVGQGLQIGASAERQRQATQQRLLLAQEKERQKQLEKEEKARLAAEQQRKTDATIAELISGQTPTTQQERVSFQAGQAFGAIPQGVPTPMTRPLRPTEKVERFASLPTQAQTDFVRIQRFQKSLEPKEPVRKQVTTFSTVDEDGFKTKEIVFDDGTREVFKSSFKEDDKKQEIEKRNFDRFKFTTRKAILGMSQDASDIISLSNQDPEAINDLVEFRETKKRIKNREFGTTGDMLFEQELTDEDIEGLLLSPEAAKIQNKRQKIRLQQDFLLENLVETQATDNAIVLMQSLEKGLPENFTDAEFVEQSKQKIDKRFTDIARDFTDGSLKISPEEFQQLVLWYQINFLQKPNVNLNE